MASPRDSYMFLLKFEGLEPLSDHQKFISYKGYNSYTFNAKINLLTLNSAGTYF